MHHKFASLLGLVVFLALAWSISRHRRDFPWRVVLWGLALQLVFALLILKTSGGAKVFELAGAAVNKLSECAMQGCAFVFGPLANEPVLRNALGAENTFIFAITVTGTIIIVSALSSLFYHWGVLQKVVQGAAWVMRRAMHTSGSETLAAAANIFMGQTEAPLVIKPYVNRMTQSELLCLMVGGMATVAGGVAAAYAQMGANAGHPDMAGHLLTASVLSAPAALMISKIMLPEKERSETATLAPARVERETVNSIDALCRGAGDGLMLALNVIGMLIAFVALIALANSLLGWLQDRAGIASPVTLQNVFGWLNAPFAWLMGVPVKDCLAVGEILGQRVVLNEFIAYTELTRPGLTLDPRSFILGTYALCGFANFSSIAIQVGGIGSLAPARRGDLAKLGLRAMVGGLLACYVTATIVGLLI